MKINMPMDKEVDNHNLKVENVTFRDLGLIDYQEAWSLQENLFNEVVNRKLSNRQLPLTDQEPQQHFLLFCEHPHVYTLGRSGDEKNLIASENVVSKDVLEALGHVWRCFGWSPGSEHQSTKRPLLS